MNDVAYRLSSVIALNIASRWWHLLPYRWRLWWATEWVRRNRSTPVSDDGSDAPTPENKSTRNAPQGIDKLAESVYISGMKNTDTIQRTGTSAHYIICDHGAYADLCITCHPTDDEIVLAAIEETKRLNVAAVDRKAREAR